MKTLKPILFENRVNGEKVLCQNPRDKQWIDGVEYLKVQRQNSSREFLMRKDALTKTKV
jgi:hypothetical protein